VRKAPCRCVLPARYASLSVLSFGGFFGAYNGIQCGAERMFGPDSLACPIFAGGTVGAVIGAVAHAVNAGMFYLQTIY